VFGLPSVIARSLGAASPWAWVIAGLGIGVVMACFAEVASRFTEAGGPYLYARVAFGRLAGIEMGWLVYLTRLTAAAANANLLVIFLGLFWPGATGPVASRVVLGGVVGSLALVNFRGVVAGTRTSNVLVIAKLVPLGIFILAGLVYMAGPRAVVPAEFTAPPATWLGAILILCFAYGGFEAALMPLGEAKDPRRDAPFALLSALVVVMLLYTLTQTVVMHALVDPATPERPVSAAADVMWGPAAGLAIGFAALVSVSGYLAGCTLNVPRLTFAMAERGDLPGVFARVHHRFHTPFVSLLCFSGLVWILAAGGSFLQNLTLSAVSRLLTYGLICAAMLRLRRGNLAPPAEFSLPGGPGFAGLGILFSLVLATRMSGREGLILAGTLVIGLLNWRWALKGLAGRQAVAGTN
jgi:basic amino acid/polyamine antiporter, APA family